MLDHPGSCMLTSILRLPGLAVPDLWITSNRVDGLAHTCTVNPGIFARCYGTRRKAS